MNKIKNIQDKSKQKMLLKSADLPVPEFYSVNDESEILSYIEILGLPVVLKSTKGGYDGKGNYVIKNKQEINKAIEELNSTDLIIEKFVKFQKELSIVVAKNYDNFVYYPIVENIHEENILRITKAPAFIDKKVEEEILNISKKTIDVLDDIGVFCIEFFLCDEGKVYINEIAPRPHNSAHYTIEGCITSQFEQLVRVITGLPLGSSKLKQTSAMVNILGSSHIEGEYTVTGLDSVLEDTQVYFHLYGKKTTNNLKKLGHITVCDESVKAAEEKALKALKSINFRAL